MKNRVIPFLNLKIDGEEKHTLLAAVDRVMQHGQFILGPEVGIFENRIADYCGCRYAIGVNSGTNALYIVLLSMGVGCGDEVIVPALSWIATANAVRMTGARPVFSDILNDLTIDPHSVRKLLNKNTKAIIPVHYTGKIANMIQINHIATENKIFVLEDAAQAFGAELNGKKAGSFGDAGIFSLNPVKVFGGCGEAGVIVTDNETIKQIAILQRYNGMIDKVHCIEPGLNARIDTLHAAILIERLNYLEARIVRRYEIALRYSKSLTEFVKVPENVCAGNCTFYTYTIQTEKRDDLVKYLTSVGIEAIVRDPLLMPQQQAYVDQSTGEFNNAKKIVGRLLSLPIHEKLSDDDVSYVIDMICKYFRGNH